MSSTLRRSVALSVRRQSVATGSINRSNVRAAEATVDARREGIASRGRISCQRSASPEQRLHGCHVRIPDG
jgi:hypothetical protein